MRCSIANQRKAFQSPKGRLQTPTCALPHRGWLCFNPQRAGYKRNKKEDLRSGFTFQSPKGRLQTQQKGRPTEWFYVSIPKGQATNATKRKTYGVVLRFNPQRAGYKRTCFDGVMCIVFFGFNPQRAGYKQRLACTLSCFNCYVSIPKGQATNTEMLITTKKQMKGFNPQRAGYKPVVMKGSKNYDDEFQSPKGRLQT